MLSNSSLPVAAKKTSQRWVLGVSLCLFVLVWVALVYTEDEIDLSISESVMTLPVVSVESISVSQERAHIEAYAEVQSRWSIDLKSEVSGAVIEVYPLAMAGNRVAKGTVLFAIDNSRYLADLAEAKQAYYQAQLAVEQAEYTSQVARKQYKQSGKTPPNDFSLHLPQLAIARAAEKATDARVEVAQRLLDQTVVRAPFSAFLVDRYVSPGQLVMAGDTTARLINDEAFDVAVSLNKTDWQLLEQPLKGQSVELLNEHDELLGQAKVRNGGGYLDQKTRHFSLHIEWNPADAEVLAGDFIKVRISGRKVDRSLNVAASAITEDGFMWSVDDNNTLIKQSVNIIFRRGERVVLEAPDTHDQWRVVRTPLSSYLPGQRVEPVLDEG